MRSSEPVSAYLAEAASWDADRAAQSRRHARIAWMVAAAGWLAALTGSVAVACLSPLKRVEPFVIRVDSSTGIADVVPAYAGTSDLGETVASYFLRHYVLTCERFNFATAELDYREC